MSRFDVAYSTIRPLRGHYKRYPLGLSAAFTPAYNILRDHEGYYVHDPQDLGGETYAGVARAIHPNWSGWPVIDAYKRSLGRPLFTNEVVPGAEPYVQAFYNSKWSSSRAGEINNQDVANIYFDFYILAARAVATLQEVLNSLGQRVSVDNRIGPQTIAAANRVNASKLYQRYKEARIRYHQERVASGAVSAKFLPGWITRTENFPDMLTPVNIGLVAAGTAMFFIIHKPARQWLKKQFI